MTGCHAIFNVSSNNLHIISITETWLTSGCNKSFVSIPGYEFYSGDVSGVVRKHGAGLYVHSSFNHAQVSVDLPNLVVVFFMDLDIYVISIYRPPSYN